MGTAFYRDGTVVAEPFTTSELFFWGAVGGGGGALATYTVPWLVRLTRGGPRPTWWMAFGGIGLLLGHSTLGGLSALVVGEATLPRQAIVFGLAWPTILHAASTTYKAVARRDDDDDDDEREVGVDEDT